MYIKSLPTELIDYITELCGLDVGILTENDYVIRKLLKRMCWQDILETCSGITIQYLRDMNHDPLDFAPVKRLPPCHTTLFLDSAVSSNDILKLQMIESLMPNTSVSSEMKKYAVNHCDKDIVDWIDINRPVHFIGNLVKHPTCTGINDIDLTRLPLDIQKRYNLRPVKCNCSTCGDGRGYSV
jgi:hypothetical protein